jgi:predicted Zn-dependent protease
MGRAKEAETRYRRALAARPDFAAAWVNLGSLLREQGRDVYAEAALRRAIGLRPDLVSGWVNMAILERERKRPGAAQEKESTPWYPTARLFRQWSPGDWSEVLQRVSAELEKMRGDLRRSQALKGPRWAVRGRANCGRAA